MLIGTWMGAEAQTRPTPTDTINLRIDFRINSSEIEPRYSENAASLRTLNSLIYNPNITFNSMIVSGTTSPDGILSKNKELAARRANSLRTYLIDAGVDPSLITIGECTVAWDGLRTLIAGTSQPWRYRALDILAQGSDNDEEDAATRMRQLKELYRGEAWELIRDELLPQLRAAFGVNAIFTDAAKVEPMAEEAEEPQTELPVAEEPVATVVNNEPAKHFIGIPLYIRTNLLRWATLTPDLGLEWRPTRQFAVLVNGSWTTWQAKSKERRYALWEVAPEVRMYLGEKARAYVGLMYKAGSFNYKFSEMGRQGDIQGGGITGGYVLPLISGLSLDFSLGLGYIHADYERYNVIDNVRVRQGKGTKNWYGPVSAGISLVWKPF